MFPIQRLKPFVFLVPATFLALLVACTTIGETGKSTLMLVSPQQEVALGASSFQELKKNVPVSQDAAKNTALQRVGRRLAAVTDMPNAQWEFVVFDNPEPNAFALPGGKVGFYTGIFPICKDEEGLAVVMSHEIAHVTLRHGGERLSQGLLVEMGRNALGLALYDNEYKTRQLADAAFGVGSAVFVTLPFSRKQELEADRIGLRYMKRAGYNPQAAVDFWKRFAEYKQARGGSAPPEYLSTHPADSQRIAQLQALVDSGNF
ncbi:M48 family metallopeptidase [Oscillatoria laete-virens NRMC-F 0139]|nr:M48 family metallopeptidase [Oscillatoria laete-virens]MDL5053076.1 M48 family metallopeptidase [Oscillatoria laete-virens NRMC-F 0139]